MAVPIRLGLLKFLRNSVQLHHTRQPPASISPIYVLGNPSADLDSIISAIVYAYFSTRECGPLENGRRQYIPVINLPDVPSGKELRRLRPEFATALRLATESTLGTKCENYVESESLVLTDCAFTVADWKEGLEAAHESNQTDVSTPHQRSEHFDIMMVDWNALPKVSSGHGIEGISNFYENIDTRVVGCVDHHVDESFIPPSSSLSPFDTRVIQTGVGSCTSLIVRDLRTRGLWSDHPAPRDEVDSFAGNTNVSQEEVAAIYESQVAKLALAAILIDTTNMTAKDKVSDVDHAAVDFLESKIQHGIEVQKSHGQHGEWDRAQFYEQILHAKQTSLENLTVQEALGRDFKEWTETAVSGTGRGNVKLGICSVVSPISWLISKATDSTHGKREGNDSTNVGEIFFGELKQFAANRNLDIVVVMTAFSSSKPGKPFQRELLVWTLNENFIGSMQRFEEEAAAQLGLESWEKDENNSDKGLYESPKEGWRRVWNQAVVSQSRKQVAPLLRNAITQKNLE